MNVRNPAVYRVFLLTDYLQLDVSVAQASKFRSTSPHFKLLFGEANKPDTSNPPLATTRWAGRCSGRVTRAYF